MTLDALVARMELKPVDGVISPVHAKLQHELGFVSDLDHDIQPYLDYIHTSWPGRGEKRDFLRVFVEAVEHLKGGGYEPGS